MRFVLQWRPLCIVLKLFPQHNTGNFSSTWIVPSKQQPLGQMLIVRGESSKKSARSILWHLLNASCSIKYSDNIRDNYCRNSESRQLVPAAYCPKNLPKWKLQLKTRLTGQQTWLPTNNSNLRTAHPIRRQKPWPGAWLIRSVSLSRWRQRFIASPRMTRSGSRRNSPSVWSS